MCRIICSRTSIASKSSAARAERFGAPTPSMASSTSSPRAPATPRGSMSRPAAGTELQEFAGARYGGSFGVRRSFASMASISIGATKSSPMEIDAAGLLEPGAGRIPHGFGAVAAGHTYVQGDIYEGRENLETGGSGAKPAAAISLGRWTHSLSDDSDMQSAVVLRPHASGATRSAAERRKSAAGPGGILRTT